MPSDDQHTTWPKTLGCSITKSYLTLSDCIECSMPGLPVLHHLPELAQTHVHWVGDAIQLSHPLLPPSSALISPQHQGLFQWVGSSHQVAKVLELQLLHQSFQQLFRVISFRIDWLDLLAVQGTLKSLLQHHSSKASILRHPKNVQTTVQLGSFHILARLCSKSFKLGFSRTWNGILFSHKKKSYHM